MAHVSEVRPISVTENIKWNLMSSISKIFWAIGTLLNMLSLTVLSLRIDRLADLNYVLNHWKHYSGEKKNFNFILKRKYWICTARSIPRKLLKQIFKTWTEVLHLAVSALKEQFLKGNVPLRHLLNLETLVMFWCGLDVDLPSTK